MHRNYHQMLEAELEKNPFVTLVDVIYTIVLHDIVSYNYKTNDQIKEATLAEEFGVSRTPIRTVVNRLIEQGFLVKEKNSVAVVKAYTPMEREDLVATRFLLEPTAMAYAAERITDRELSVLKEYTEKLSAACLAQDMILAFEYENRFHDYVFHCCRNDFLIKQYDAVKHYFYQSRMFFTANSDFYGYYIQEHQLLFSVLKLRDSNLARAAMVRHLSVIRTPEQSLQRANPSDFDRNLQTLAQKK